MLDCVHVENAVVIYYVTQAALFVGCEGTCSVTEYKSIPNEKCLAVGFGTAVLIVCFAVDFIVYTFSNTAMKKVR